MLDDLKMIHERDAQDALGVAEKQWEQLLHEYGVELAGFKDISNVVLAGMGGSSLPAVYLRAWPAWTGSCRAANPCPLSMSKRRS